MNLDIMSNLPSAQDLASAASTFALNMPSVIYPESGGETILSPIPGHIPNINIRKYNELIKKAIETGNIDIVINGLRQMGIEMSGKINGKTIGKPSKIKSEVEKIGSSLPRHGKKEIGGVSGMTTGGKKASDTASKRFTGTEKDVKIEVEYDPQNLPKEVDKTFMYHTHPKMTNNNYL